MDTAGRIFELLKTTGMEQKKFASLVGVSPQKVSEWKSGKARSYTRRIPLIAEVLGTTSEYLLTGNGPKYRNQSALFVDVSGSMGKKEPAPMRVSDSDTKPDWLIKFEELSPGAQKEVIAFIEFKRGQE